MGWVSEDGGQSKHPTNILGVLMSQGKTQCVTSVDCIKL